MGKYLDDTGVAYLWSKVKAAFAAKTHTHAAGDVTSGTFATARIPSLAASKITSGTLATARGGVPTGGTAGQVLTKNSATNNDVAWTTPSGGGTTVDIPTGSITMFAGSTAPTGYLLCQGQAVSRTAYSALFAIIGTAYGAGDGSTTFNLPNLQGRFPLGKSSGHALASTGGAETVTLTTNEVPAHTHGSKSITGQVGQVIVPNSDMSYSSDSLYFEYKDNVDYASDGYSNNCRRRVIKLNATHEHDSVGDGTAHENMPPYQTVNYIIKT